MVLSSPGPAASSPLVLTDLDDPVPAPGEVLIDVTACAVCRTDLQICEGDLPARRSPVVPGHQAVGRVAALGPGVDGPAVGERVGVAWLGGACGSCGACDAGSENLCDHATFTGWDRDGGFAERMVARADFVHRLPDDLADEDAAPLLCGGVIGYRSLRLSGVRPGGRLGLYGFGASALLAIQVAVHRGCEVSVHTRSRTERERALEMGARFAGDIDDPPPWPLDGAVTFAPAGRVVIAALRALAPGGTVAINAIHLDEIPAFDYDLLWRERSLRSVANFTRDDAREFLTLAAAIPVRTTTEIHPLEDANRALQRVADGTVSGAAVLRIGR